MPSPHDSLLYALSITYDYDYENIPDLGSSDRRLSAASMKPQQSALTDSPGCAPAE